MFVCCRMLRHKITLLKILRYGTMIDKNEQLKVILYKRRTTSFADMEDVGRLHPSETSYTAVQNGLTEETCKVGPWGG